jgi:DNA polymerase-3 subunit epsilon
LNLPPKIETLRRATVFNKNTRKKAFEKLKNDKTYLLKCLKEDVKENVIFRNYNDYLISVVLEKENLMERFKPFPRQKAFSSKDFLRYYINDLKKTPKETKIKKIGGFDTETTDITGYIISYAIVIQDMQDLGTKEIYELLNPQAKISEEAFGVHKISQEELKDKPSFKEKKDEILNIFNSLDMVVGHNVLYDFGVMKRELERVEHYPNIIDIPIFDTMYYAADVVVLEKKKMPRLEEAIAFFFGRKNINYHNALEDVKATLKLFNRLLEEG